MRRFFVGLGLGAVLSCLTLLGYERLTPRNCYPVIPNVSAHWLNSSLKAGWVIDNIWDPSGLNIICLRRPLVPSSPDLGSP